MEYLALCYGTFFYGLLAIGALVSAVRLGKFGRFM